jgi:hypothetical protein
VNLGQSFPDDDVDEDIAELDLSAGDLDELEIPIDPPIVPGGRDNARIPAAEGADDDTSARSRPITDDEISARVHRLLRSDSATSMLRIHVSTEDGVVTLTGSVETLDDTDNAAEVAFRVKGVVDVVDELEVDL